MLATWFGAETIVGSAGTAYAEGVSLGSAEPFGYGLCLIVMGLIFAVPLHRRKLTTLADLYRQRYSVGVERLAAPGQLVVANHPSLIDVLFIGAQMPQVGCIVKESLQRNPFLGAPIRWAGYIPNSTPEHLIENCLTTLRGSRRSSPRRRPTTRS